MWVSRTHKCVSDNAHIIHRSNMSCSTSIVVISVSKPIANDAMEIINRKESSGCPFETHLNGERTTEWLKWSSQTDTLGGRIHLWQNMTINCLPDVANFWQLSMHILVTGGSSPERGGMFHGKMNNLEQCTHICRFHSLKLDSTTCVQVHFRVDNAECSWTTQARAESVVI